MGWGRRVEERVRGKNIYIVYTCIYTCTCTCIYTCTLYAYSLDIQAVLCIIKEYSNQQQSQAYIQCTYVHVHVYTHVHVMYLSQLCGLPGARFPYYYHHIIVSYH